MNRRKTIGILGALMPLLVKGEIIYSSLDPHSQNNESLDERILSQEELNSLSKIVDALLPKTDTPSASDIGAPSKIEQYLIDNHSAKMRQHFKDGLHTTMRLCEDNYGKKTYECSVSELSDVLLIIIQHTNQGTALDTYPFYPLLKGLTISVFFSSKEMQLYFRNERKKYKF